jgi:hypothetical protein
MADVRQMRLQYARLLQGVIERGILSGELAPTNPTLAALQIFGMCNYSWTWLRPFGKQSVEEVANTFIRGIVFGMLQRENADAPAALDLDRVLAVVTEVMASPPVAP